MGQETVSFSFGENWLKFVKNLDHEQFEEVCSYLDKEGFRLRNSKRTKSTGCDEFVFEKKVINQ